MISAETIQEAIEHTRASDPQTEVWCEAEGIDLAAIVQEVIAPYVMANPILMMPLPDPMTAAISGIVIGIRMGVYAGRKEWTSVFDDTVGPPNSPEDSDAR